MLRKNIQSPLRLPASALAPTTGKIYGRWQVAMLMRVKLV